MIFERFKSLLTRIANAIRKQGGFTDLIPAEQLDIAIESLVANDENFKGVVDGTIVGPLNLKYSGLQFRSHAFANCKKLENIILPDGLTKIPTHTFYNCIALENLVIPDTVTEIGDSAFSNCTSIKSIVIPDSVITIGQNAFFELTALEEIFIPGTSTWSTNSFKVNSSECKMYFSGTLDTYASKTFSSENYSLTNMNTKLYFLNKNNEYYLLNNLMKLTTSLIKPYAFYGYANFEKNIAISDSVTKIDKYAFSACSTIETITIPDSVTEIVDNAFASCSGLQSVVIGQGISTLGKYIFNYSSNMKMLELKATTPPTISSYSLKGSFKIYVPKGTRDTYISATNWSALASRIIEPNIITISVPNALLNNDNYTYSTDNGETWNQFASELFTVANVTAIKFKSLDANTTILFGTTEGGSDIGTIANAELLYPTSADQTIYLTVA